jgi:hypothetical protein
MSRFHSAHAYEGFEGLIDVIEKAMTNASIPAACGCQPLVVRQRLMQRLVEHLLGPYVVMLGNYIRQGMPPLEKSVGNLELTGATVSTKDGRINISFGLFCSALKDFGLHWLLALLAILTLMPRIRLSGPVTVVLGVGAESVFSGGSGKRFIEYCNRGPIAPLNTGDILVQVGALLKSGTGDRIQYAKYPFHALAASAQLKSRRRLSLLFRHLVMPCSYVWAFLRNPVMVLLSRDYAQTQMMSALNNQGSIQSIVFTNSNYSIQPLWARAKRNYKTHMVWYSQNTIPPVYKQDKILSDLPNYRHMYMDEHWVWTHAYKQYLVTRLAQAGPIHVVGPIVWYLPEAQHKKVDQTDAIVVFDITPVSDQYAQSLGVLDNYYNSATALRFMQGILSTVEQVEAVIGRKITIRLKHKRAYAVTHDQGYIAYVTAAINSKKIEIVPYDESIYSLAAASDAAITIPYSTAAHIPSAIGKVSIYFDPTDDLLPSSVEKNILFVSGEAALLRTLMKVFSRN